MKIKVVREEFNKEWTAGRMFLDDKPFCYTLEDVVRPLGADKVYGATAIPAGTYKVIIDRSTRFGRDMPHVLDVPGFQGIRIHSGNTDKDTEGCILLGDTHVEGMGSIGKSRNAYNRFFPLLQAALNLKEQVTLEIV